MPEPGRSSAASAFIGVAFRPAPDGSLSTDSTSAYEAVALGAHFGSLRLHGLVSANGNGRDRLTLPPGMSFVPLGTVGSGRDLYGSTPRLAVRILRSCRRDRTEPAVIFETGLVSLLALAGCAVARRPAIAAIRGDSARTAATAERYRRGWPRAIGLGLAAMHVASQWAAARTVPVVVDSEEMATRVRRWGGRPLVIPAASVRASDVLDGRRFWAGPPEGPLRLLWVGRFERVKGLEHLIRALGLVVAAGAPVALELVGGGDPAYLARIRSLVGHLGLSGRVLFAGPLPHEPELYERYRNADLFVLPSLSEGTPKVVAEAFAHGLPVVASAVGALPRLLRPGLGTVVPPGDHRALAAALLAYARHPERVRTEGEGCLAEAVSLTVEGVSARLADAVAEARPPRWRRRRAAR